MRGNHHIVIESENLKYEFDIKRNITVIQGESASGKTTLIDLLNEHLRRRGAGGIRMQSDVSCAVYVAGEDNWEYELKGLSGKIVFFDEDYRFIYTKEFAEYAGKADNYFVFITRKPLKNLPYSINEIYGIRTTGKYHFPEQVYHEFYPIYEDKCNLIEPKARLMILVEDKESGYEFFTKVSDACKTVSAEGNAGIFPKMLEIPSDERVLVVADGAAFGAYAETVVKYAKKNGKVGLYFPESFEWMVLKSGVLEDNEIDRVLAEPENYIDSQEYISWERFFTALLIEKSQKERYMRYSKTKLPDYYLEDRNRKRIVDVIPEEIRMLLE
ncbi:MAG: ATP-binding protein [Lachnospiraceae bacterium]|nr:ATP-binding protein [Lachnospiraceae bacterium]